MAYIVERKTHGIFIRSKETFKVTKEKYESLSIYDVALNRNFCTKVASTLIIEIA